MSKVQVRAVEPCFIDNIYREMGQEFAVDESMADCGCLERIDNDASETAKQVDGRRKRAATEPPARLN